METKTPWHAQLAFALALLMPVYFVMAALGTKLNLWDWKVGLGALTIGAGPFLLGIVAVLAFVSLILILRKAPRNGWIKALIALIIPAGIFAFGASAGSTAQNNPIYDIATDITNPPSFSDTVMAKRDATGSNPVNDYAVPLGEIEWWNGKAGEERQKQSHAQIVGELYPDLTSLPLGGATPSDALAAIESGMADVGLKDITANAEAGTVEGVAETFWYGFKDDVIARVADDKIDFRSVSRVGVSDLGANSKRIVELRAAVANHLAQ